MPYLMPQSLLLLPPVSTHPNPNQIGPGPDGARVLELLSCGCATAHGQQCSAAMGRRVCRMCAADSMCDSVMLLLDTHSVSHVAQLSQPSTLGFWDTNDPCDTEPELTIPLPSPPLPLIAGHTLCH